MGDYLVRFSALSVDSLQDNAAANFNQVRRALFWPRFEPFGFGASGRLWFFKLKGRRVWKAELETIARAFRKIQKRQHHGVLHRPGGRR